MEQYPNRPAFFAYRFTRLLFRTCAAQDIGHEAILLLIHVAHTEDAKRYSAAVSFWNHELESVLSISWGRLDRSRKKAVEAGWLHYERGGKGKVGKYWVTIPEPYQSIPDGPMGDETGDLHPHHSDTNENAADLYLHHSDTTGGQPGDNRDTTGGQPGDKRGSFYPKTKTSPKTGPKSITSNGQSTDLQSICKWWNTLRDAGLVTSGVNELKPSRAVLKGWRRVQKDPVLRQLAANRDDIEAAIRASPFTREGWFRLERLLGGTNKDGEFIIRKLLDGGYRDTRSRAQAREPTAGQRYDPSHEYGKDPL